MQHKTYTPYTYLIGWTEINKWYYGSEYKNNRKGIAHPDNLWRTYFTSSKLVQKIRNQYGEPDIIRIRKIFRDADSAISWESRVLQKMKVVNNDMWLNMQCGDGKFRRKSGPYKITEQTREKLRRPRSKRTPEQNKRNSEARLGIKRSKESIEKQKETIRLKGFNTAEHMLSRGMTNKGKTFIMSEETKRKISETRKSKFASGDIIPHMLGKTHTEESKRKISESKKINQIHIQLTQSEHI